jgi:hypothetical protein
MKQVYDRKPRKMARLIYPSCVELGTDTSNVQNTVTLIYGASFFMYMSVILLALHLSSTYLNFTPLSLLLCRTLVLRTRLLIRCLLPVTVLLTLEFRDLIALLGVRVISLEKMGK